MKPEGNVSVMEAQVDADQETIHNLGELALPGLQEALAVVGNEGPAEAPFSSF